MSQATTYLRSGHGAAAQTTLTAQRIAESLLDLAYAAWCAAMDACDDAYARGCETLPADAGIAYAAHVAALDREELAARELGLACGAAEAFVA